MKQPITAETLFKDFVKQIETAVAGVATQVPYISVHSHVRTQKTCEYLTNITALKKRVKKSFLH